ncbi:MAG: GatB/YqeY domain-containing protein [bacterium]
MSLLANIDKDTAEALKAGEKEKVTVLRGLKSDIKYRQIEKRDTLTDEEVAEVVSSFAKKCRDSIEEFKKGNREDLVKKTEFELEVIAKYLPEQLSEEKLREIIKAAIEESGADSPQKMGLVMKIVMPQIKGKADGKLVSKIASELLAN